MKIRFRKEAAQRVAAEWRRTIYEASPPAPERFSVGHRRLLQAGFKASAMRGAPGTNGDPLRLIVDYIHEGARVELLQYVSEFGTCRAPRVYWRLALLTDDGGRVQSLTDFHSWRACVEAALRLAALGEVSGLNAHDESLRYYARKPDAHWPLYVLSMLLFGRDVIGGAS